MVDEIVTNRFYSGRLVDATVVNLPYGGTVEIIQEDEGWFVGIVSDYAGRTIGAVWRNTFEEVERQAHTVDWRHRKRRKARKEQP